MEPSVKIPTTEEIKKFLDAFGWKYREVSPNPGQTTIIAPYKLLDQNRGILISFHIEGEFFMASTNGFLKNIPKTFSHEILLMNDTIKLVKLYGANSDHSDQFDAEIGFELWNESWNQDTFFAFLDMVCLGIEKVMENMSAKNIPHDTNFVTFD